VDIPHGERLECLLLSFTFISHLNLRYQVMLECWHEHPIDRPTFSELRKKFGDLLMASTSDSYMMLEVDESKTYYTMGEEEDNKKGSQNSLDSEDSDSSIKKPKKKKIEKPKWAQDANAYVDTPSTFKEGHTHAVDEHYRHNTVGAVDIEEKRSKMKSNGGAKKGALDSRDAESLSSSQQGTPSHAPLSLSTSLPPARGQVEEFNNMDDVGIPLSFVTVDKQNGKSQGGSSSGQKAVKKTRCNPYVDDPRTVQPLVEVQPGGDNGVFRDDRLVGNGQEMKLTPLTAELTSRLTARHENEDRVTAM